MAEERLQKWLARQGFGSRREIEGWIRAGRVTVNGVAAELGTKVAGHERICVDNKAVRRQEREVQQRTLIYHKPPDEICTRNDPEGRRTVFHSLPRILGARWISVGRLDYQTTGLLIVTTDGELANRLMHPSSELQREYIVRAMGEPSDELLALLTRGVVLDDGPARFDSLEITESEGVNKTYRVTVTEGRNRIVRRLFEHVDCRVNRLMRVRYGPIALPRDLRPGKYRELITQDIELLRAAVGL